MSWEVRIGGHSETPEEAEPEIASETRKLIEKLSELSDEIYLAEMYGSVVSEDFLEDTS